jgi:hypothetical protein
MKPWLHYLIASVVFCHGFIYVRIGAVLPEPIPAWKGSSWLVGGAVTNDQLKGLVVALHVIAGIGIVACSLAMAFGGWAPGWWRPFAIGGAAVGIAAFAVFWDGQVDLLVEEGAIGAVVSLILLMSAVIFPSAFD